MLCVWTQIYKQRVNIYTKGDFQIEADIIDDVEFIDIYNVYWNMNFSFLFFFTH